MALLLRAAKEQLLASKSAPWLQNGLRVVSRSFAAQAEPVEEDEGAYVVTAWIHFLCSAACLINEQAWAGCSCVATAFCVP